MFETARLIRDYVAKAPSSGWAAEQQKLFTTEQRQVVACSGLVSSLVTACMESSAPDKDDASKSDAKVDSRARAAQQADSARALTQAVKDRDEARQRCLDRIKLFLEAEGALSSATNEWLASARSILKQLREPKGTPASSAGSAGEPLAEDVEMKSGPAVSSDSKRGGAASAAESKAAAASEDADGDAEMKAAEPSAAEQVRVSYLWSLRLIMLFFSENERRRYKWPLTSGQMCISLTRDRLPSAHGWHAEPAAAAHPQAAAGVGRGRGRRDALPQAAAHAHRLASSGQCSGPGWLGCRSCCFQPRPFAASRIRSC